MLFRSFLFKGRVEIFARIYPQRYMGWMPEKVLKNWTGDGWVVFDAPESGGVWLPKGRAKSLGKLTRYIKTHTEPDDPIFIIPAQGILYFLADRPSAYRVDVAFDSITEKHRRELADALLKKKPLIIKFSTGYIDLDYEVEHVEEMKVINEYYRLVDKVQGAEIYIPK